MMKYIFCILLGIFLSWGFQLISDDNKVEKCLESYSEYNILLDGNETSYYLWKAEKCRFGKGRNEKTFCNEIVTAYVMIISL